MGKMAGHISGIGRRKTERPKLDEITGALVERRKHHRDANMRTGFQRACKREKARRGEQIAADLIERENDEISAWQAQKRESAVEQSCSKLHTNHQRNRD